MKTFFITALFFVSANIVLSQDVKKALEDLNGLEDLHGNNYSHKGKGDELIIISIGMTNDPFKVYDLLKDVKFKPSVEVVGSFSSPGSHTAAVPIGHLKEGFTGRYGKDYLSVWLDPSGSVATDLGVKGHSIVTISIKNNKVTQVQDFGFKLDEFAKALEKLKTKK